MDGDGPRWIPVQIRNTPTHHCAQILRRSFLILMFSDVPNVSRCIGTAIQSVLPYCSCDFSQRISAALLYRTQRPIRINGGPSFVARALANQERLIFRNAAASLRLEQHVTELHGVRHGKTPFEKGSFQSRGFPVAIQHRGFRNTIRRKEGAAPEVRRKIRVVLKEAARPAACCACLGYRHALALRISLSIGRILRGGGGTGATLMSSGILQSVAGSSPASGRPPSLTRIPQNCVQRPARNPASIRLCERAIADPVQSALRPLSAKRCDVLIGKYIRAFAQIRIVAVTRGAHPCTPSRRSKK